MGVGNGNGNHLMDSDLLPKGLSTLYTASRFSFHGAFVSPSGFLLQVLPPQEIAKVS